METIAPAPPAERRMRTPRRIALARRPQYATFGISAYPIAIGVDADYRARPAPAPERRSAPVTKA